MFDISRKFTVHIDGRADIAVTPADHVASGGEGHVYRPKNGALALKIWDDPHHAITSRMVEKIKLLSALKHPSVVAPESLARDRGGNILGYIMPWVSGWDLPVAFTNDWRSANSFGDKEAWAFAEQMRQVVIFVHSHNVVMGDANELNILGQGGAPRYIDVDPWLPPGYRGDKIMPTIQDQHGTLFTKEADWFAWAVVTFQLLTGVHPYRGTHPDFKRSDLEGRMKANASVFDPKTRLNAAVRPFNLIPAQLLDWYSAAFQTGERALPPEVKTTSTIAAKTPMIKVTASGRIIITEMFTMTSLLRRVVAPDVLMLMDGTLVSLPDGRVMGHGGGSFIRSDSGLLRAAVDNGVVSSGIVSPGSTIPMSASAIGASSLWTAGNRLFAVGHDGILELLSRDVGHHMLLTGLKWSVNQNATVFGDGVAILDALGAKYIVAPQQGKSVAVVRVKELDGLKPVMLIGRDKTMVLSLIDRAGAYHRAVIVLPDTLSSYRIDITPADDGALTDIILDNGLILWLTATGELGLSTGDVLPLAGLSGGRLVNGPSGVFYISGLQVFRLSMGSP